MSDDVKCFMIEPTELGILNVHMFVTGQCGKANFHFAMADVRRGTRADWDNDTLRPTLEEAKTLIPKCASCGLPFEFGGENRFGCGFSPLYRNPTTGETKSPRDFGPGAMWDADWMHRDEREPGDNWHIGADGRSLVVICPDGKEWQIDGVASNCTMKNDRTHKCWVRHGEPPMITVGKDGLTCAAGAGSIDTGTWHGFLRAGVFQRC